MRQKLITNYLPMGNPGRTINHNLKQNPPPNHIRFHTMVQTDGHGSFWAVIPELPNIRLGELEIYVDGNEEKWINYIEVVPQCQRCGVAVRLVRAAIQAYGHIYASNSPYDIGGGGDSRHLSVEGAALVNYLINNNIMQAGWLRAPVL